jgi:hypothetical protein
MSSALLDSGLSSASGIAVAPDRGLLLAAEANTKWIYSYVLQGDNALQDKQRYFWLHMTDIPNNSGAEDICYDVNGNLYVATNMGIQVADRSGRVRAILPLPTPCGPVSDVLAANMPIVSIAYRLKGVDKPLCQLGDPAENTGLTEQASTALKALVSYLRDKKPLPAARE